MYDVSEFQNHQFSKTPLNTVDICSDLEVYLRPHNIYEVI